MNKNKISMTSSWVGVCAGMGLAAAFLGGCQGADECTATYPAAPNGASDVVHVAACGGAGADGSAKMPYATISAAIEAVRSKPGAAILVAPGTYTENLVVNSDVNIVGSNNPDRHEDAAIILQSPNPQSVRIENAAMVTMTGVRIKDSIGVGVWVRDGASLTLNGSSVDTVTADADGVGYGVLSSDDAAIILQHTEVTGAAVMGVLVMQSRAIILQSNLHDNAGTGLRIEQATAEIQVQDSELQGNTQSAVTVMNSRAIILQSKLMGTKLDANGVGDGLLVGGLSSVDAALFPTEVVVKDSTLSDNGRVGFLASGAVARTIILQNNTISGNSATGTMGAGVWIQGGAGSAAESIMEGNVVSQNRYLGVCLRGDTHGIILQNNQITATVLATAFSGVDSIELGDGIHVVAGASAKIMNNKIDSNGRVGMILDNALGASTVIEGNTFSSNGEYGAAIQSTSNAPSTAGNTFQNNSMGDVAMASSYTIPAADLVRP